jgi:hypothetical protein
MSSIFTVGSAAVPFILAVAGIAVSIQAPKGRTEKWAWILGFILLGIFCVVLQIVSSGRQDAKINNLQKKIDTLQTSLSRLPERIAENLRPCSTPAQVREAAERQISIMARGEVSVKVKVIPPKGLPAIPR